MGERALGACHLPPDQSNSAGYTLTHSCALLLTHKNAFARQSLLVGLWEGHYNIFSDLDDGIRGFANLSLLSEVGFRSATGVTAWFFILNERIKRAQPSCSVELPTIFHDYRQSIDREVYITRTSLEGTSVLRAVVSFESRHQGNVRKQKAHNGFESHDHHSDTIICY